MANWQQDYFGDKLVTKDGLKLTSDVFAGKKFIGIYFSAHWCPVRIIDENLFPLKF